MNLTQLKQKLETTGLPVAYEVFPKERTPQLPFIAYAVVYSNNFSGDTSVYKVINHIEVRLYTAGKDPDTEAKVEEALSFTYWEKEEDYIDDEKIVRITYDFDLI